MTIYVHPPYKGDILVCQCGSRFQFSLRDVVDSRRPIMDVNLYEWKKFHDVCSAVQQGGQLHALRRSVKWRAANFIINLGMRLAGFGGD